MNRCSVFLLKFWCGLWIKKKEKNRILGSCGSKIPCKADSFTTVCHQCRSPSDELSFLLPKENLSYGSSRGNCCVMFYIVWECFLLFLEIFYVFELRMKNCILPWRCCSNNHRIKKSIFVCLFLVTQVWQNRISHIGVSVIAKLFPWHM